MLSTAEQPVRLHIHVESPVVQLDIRHERSDSYETGELCQMYSICLMCQAKICELALKGRFEGKLGLHVSICGRAMEIRCNNKNVK